MTPDPKAVAETKNMCTYCNGLGTRMAPCPDCRPLSRESARVEVPAAVVEYARMVHEAANENSAADWLAEWVLQLAGRRPGQGVSDGR